MSLIEVKSCNALLSMLLVCISICLVSVLRYTFLILGTYHPDIICLCKQGCETPWVFFEAKRGPQKKKRSEKHYSKWPAPSLADVPSISLLQTPIDSFHSPQTNALQ
jgi:hypothetical protein